MITHDDYQPLDKHTLEHQAARAGMAVEMAEIEQLLPLANELLEMSNVLSAYVGPLVDLSPIYVVDAARKNGADE